MKFGQIADFLPGFGSFKLYLVAHLNDVVQVLLVGLVQAVVVGFHLLPQFRHLFLQLELDQRGH